MRHQAALAEIRQALRCPAHHRTLQWHIDELMTLRCEGGCQVELRDGIPRFVAIDQYAESFGLQWNAYRRTQLDSYTGCSYSRLRLERCLGLPLVSLSDKTVLEVGAGAGRFSEWLLPHSGVFVALDVSTAVDAHRANFAQRYDYLLVQADINASPLPERFFDLVVCLGVIQHTPSPEQTIASLAAHVRPGGMLVIDHYTHRSWLSPIGSVLSMRFVAREVLRRVARRRPYFALRVTKAMTAAFDPIRRRASCNPWLDRVAYRIFPVQSYYRNYPDLPADILYAWNELDTYDSLTDWFKHYRSTEQIRSTLEGLGLEVLACGRGGNGVEARARRPDVAT